VDAAVPLAIQRIDCRLVGHGIRATRVAKVDSDRCEQEGEVFVADELDACRAPRQPGLVRSGDGNWTCPKWAMGLTWPTTQSLTRRIQSSAGLKPRKRRRLCCRLPSPSSPRERNLQAGMGESATPLLQHPGQSNSSLNSKKSVSPFPSARRRLRSAESHRLEWLWNKDRRVWSRNDYRPRWSNVHDDLTHSFVSAG